MLAKSRLLSWTKINENGVELLLFISAFLLRALYALVIQVTAGAHGFISFSDAEFFYYQAALNLLNHHAFSLAASAPFHPEAYHTPLYPLFIASFLFLHFPLFGIVIVQDFICALIAVLTYRIGIVLTNSWTISVSAAIIAALEPMSIYWSGLLMSDTLWAFLVITSIYLFTRNRPYLSLFTLGLSAWVRPISLYFMPIFIVMFIYHLYTKKESGLKIAKNAAIIVCIFIATVFPWSLRNKLVFNTWSFTSASWYLMYGFPVGEFSQKNELPHPSVPPGIPADYTRFDFKYAAAYKNASLELISRNPIGFGVVYFDRIIYSFFSNRYDYLVHQVIASKIPGVYSKIPGAVWAMILIMGELFWLCIYVLVLIAGLERKMLPWWLFFMALLCISSVLSGGINPVGTDMSRYNLAFFPFFFIFAGVGVNLLKRHLRIRF
jgi:hypothetical protein